MPNSKSHELEPDGTQTLERRIRHFKGEKCPTAEKLRRELSIVQRAHLEGSAWDSEDVLL